MSTKTDLPDLRYMLAPEYRFAQAMSQMERELSKIPQRLKDDALFTTKQTAAHLNISARTLEGWRTDGRGPAITRLPGGGVRYSGAAIRAFIAAHEQGAA